MLRKIFLICSFFAIFSLISCEQAELKINKGDMVKEPLPEPKVLVTEASVSKYAWTGNRMANGEYPHPGACATSDYSVPLGSIAYIDGERYIIKDRTALWIQPKFGFTLDIYSEETVENMLKFGRKNRVVVVEMNYYYPYYRPG